MKKKTMYGVGTITASENYIAINDKSLAELIAKEILPDCKDEHHAIFRSFCGKITVILEYEPTGFWCADDEEVAK